jgi:hypothetical protein
MKRLLASTLIGCLALSVNLSVATAAVKPGTTCKTLGQTSTSAGMKYTCIKSGKKLIWNKGVKVVKANPTPATTQTPAPVPVITQAPAAVKFEAWSLNIDSKSLSDQAQQSFLSWAKEKVAVATNHTQIIQTNTNTKRVSILKKADDLSAQLFGSYFPEGSLTVIGATEMWTIEQLAKSGWTTTCRGQGMPGVTYCLDNGKRHAYIVASDSGYDPRNPGSDGGALLVHEYFHLVQANLSKTLTTPRIKGGDDATKNAFPDWFNEGAADFVGYSVAALSQNASYWDGRSKMLTYAPPEESVSKNAIADYEISTCCGNNTPTYPYNVGQVATEYIVASIGFQKMLDIWIDYGTTRNFEKSFESITGISKEAFYEKFDQLRTRVGLPPISWRLDGLVNKKIG